MSYNTDIIDDNGRVAETVGNMTSNIGVMYRLVLRDSHQGGGRYNGEGESEALTGLPGLSGLKCSVAAPLILDALIEMFARRDEMILLEPENGWGSYSGAVKYLSEILSACCRNPQCTLSVKW